MPKPSEHKSVQSHILACAKAIGWTLVSREESDARRAGFPTRRLPCADAQECPPSVTLAHLSLMPGSDTF